MCRVDSYFSCEGLLLIDVPKLPTDYVSQQDEVERLHFSATIHNDNIIGAASFNIIVGIFVATIFGAGFFDLFWPERSESKEVRLAWKICSVLTCIFALGDALALTIIVATKAAYVTASSYDLEQTALSVLTPPLGMFCSMVSLLTPLVPS